LPEQTPRLDGAGIIRGAGQETGPQIVLDAPSGELAALPLMFVWQTDQACETYTLEIFTADLKMVFSLTDIPAQSWTIAAELTVLLQPDTIYLWSVRGYRQLQVVAESGNSWFRFID